MASIPYAALRRASTVGLSHAEKRQCRNMDAIPYGLVGRCFRDEFTSPVPDPFWNCGPGDAPLYEDAFDGTALKPFWIPGDPSPTVSGGVMHMLAGSRTQPGNYVQVTTPTFDARGKGAVIEAIPHVWDGSDSSDRDFAIWPNGATDFTNAIYFEVYQDTLFFGLNGSQSVPYDPVAHRWWKLAISVNGTAGYCLASPNGIAWMLLARVDVSGSDWTAALGFVDAGNRPGANTDVQYDNFKVAVEANAYQSGGVAHTRPVSIAYDANYVAGPFDLRGKSVVIEAIPDGVRGVDRNLQIQDAADSSFVNADSIDHDSTSAAQGGVDPDTLFFGTYSGSWTGSVPYDPVAHRWWRIRTPADGSPSFIDVSPDGVTWTNLGRATGTWDRSRAYISFGAGQYASTPIPADTDVQWANFSLSG